MATTDYGTDVKALDDLPDPEELVSGDLNVAYALGRRLLQPVDALEEIADLEEFACIDLRDYLGESIDDQELAALEQRVNEILAQDPRVDSVEATVSFNDGALSVDASGFGVDGPFSFVLSADALSVDLLVRT